MIPTLAEALAERGYDALTDVQQAVTAPELAEADLLVSAQTGSGKTVGFGLAIAQTLLGGAERMSPPAAPLALVIAPTRELALQVQRELEWLYAKAGARVVSCIGGMDAREERRALDRGAHIVVGTPGRLRDHITRRALDLTDIRAIVLDEADEMLDLGFREDLEFMLGEAPADRRTLMFSATVPPAIAELAKQFQRDAVRVTTVTRGAQHADIAYQVVQVSAADVEHAIINLLRYHDAPTAIVFANTRATVARLAARLANRSLPVVTLSGELSQDERTHALQAMRDGRARVCVATDVAARGIDLPKLDLVIHADLPTNTEALLHRSGRTGRAGRKGISAMIVPDKMTGKAQRLLKWSKIEAEWVFAPTADEVLALDEARLLSDEIWTKPANEGEAEFSAKLMATHTPEQIATACLRLYRAGLSAPEELNAPGTSAPRAERATFGPSVWFELSVGQGKRAEARWLLPLLCRAGNLDKAQIGKIRVQADTTLVELAEAAVPGFLAQIGPGGVLEDDVTARQMDGTPDIAPQPRTPYAERPPRLDRPPRPDRPDRAPRPPRPDDAVARPRKPDAAKPYTPKPRDEAPRPPRPDVVVPRPVAPPRSEDAPAPARKPDYKPSKPYKPREAGAAPARTGGKPYAKAGPRDDARGGPKDGPRKPRGPEGKKEWVKPKHDHTPKPPEAGPRAGASDTSKRMERPGAKPRPSGPGKPGGPGGKPRSPGGSGKPPRKGGGAPPRRKG
ncbi:DEAD/DEAH box helicase [Roseicyclus mahoneyensis]|uniref:ATP-dependent RNA helicase DeaD n=1 Tax=Roseicyclus mahoneyensis TaxID=164332 RepID=A0A316GMH7_9RHOB|nr:DEAD/DEAH box helicase [Roseicyclus mahoneyensis]PWK61499.1 ATP-dependent RNA helicase DeaD [Roseicyclus mahoneyensis]